MGASTLPEISATPTAASPEHGETAPAHCSRSDLYLDLFERLLVAGFFAWLAWRLVIDYRYQGNVGSLLMLPSEGLVVVLMLIRRTSRVLSHRLGDWLMAMGATCAPLLIVPAGQHALVPLAFGGSMLLMGMFIQLHAKFTLGRSIGCVAAHRGLQLRGPYRFVRHPMYAGYLVSHLAFLALNPSLWNVGVYALCYALQIPRLLREERLLSEDPSYRDYQARVRFRLIPGIF